MRTFIPIDFDVEEIDHNEINSRTFFYKRDNDCSILEHHFVSLEEGMGNLISQFKILRFELAKFLFESINSNNKSIQQKLSSGYEVFINDKKGDQILTLVFAESNQKIELNFTNPKEDDFFVTILYEDIELYKNTKKYLAKEGGLKVLAKYRLKSKLQEYLTDLSDEDLELVCFEGELFRQKKIKLPSFSLTNILKNRINELGEVSWLISFLFENIDFVYNNQECNCGDNDCFFDVLKENQQFFLNKDYLDENKEIIKKKLEEDFLSLWTSFSIKQKLSLKLLESEFQNSTLLNLYFLQPNFNLSEYQRLMCVPYQPDSYAESQLRSVSTMAAWLAKSSDLLT